MTEGNQRVFWAIPLLVTIVLGAIATYIKFSPEEKITDRAFTVIMIIIGVIIIVILSIVIFYNSYANLIKFISFRLKKGYSDFIFNTVKMRLEYLTDDGSLVGCERIDHITKLSLKKSKHMVNVSLEFDGEINRKDAQAINGAFSFPSISSAYLHCYVKKQNLLSKAHRSKFFLTVNHSFEGLEQFWVIGADNFCNHLFIDIVLPITRNIEEVAMYYYDIPEKDKKNYGSVLNYKPSWMIVRDPKFIIIKQKNQRIISAQITALKPSDIYKLVWKFSN